MAPPVFQQPAITDNHAYNPSIDTTAFPATPLNYFWSSSSYANDVSVAWGVSFTGGPVYGYGKSNASYVRCVRGGP